MTDDWVDEVVQQMLVDYTAWVNGEPVPWNVRKTEAKDYIRAKQAEAVEAAQIEELHKTVDMLDRLTGQKYLTEWGDYSVDYGFVNAELNLIKKRLDQLTNNTEKR